MLLSEFSLSITLVGIILLFISPFITLTWTINLFYVAIREADHNNRNTLLGFNSTPSIQFAEFSFKLIRYKSEEALDKTGAAALDDLGQTVRVKLVAEL